MKLSQENLISEPLSKMEILSEYETSLKELTSTSKPLINMLTMLADDNKVYAASIVRLVERRLLQVIKEW